MKRWSRVNGFLNEINGIDISKSTKESPIVNFVKSISEDHSMERFFDELLSDTCLLRVMSSSLNDLGAAEKDSPIVLFSYSNGAKEALVYLEEYSKQCEYLIPPLIRNIRINNLISLDNISAEEREMYTDALFRINEFYGQIMYIQVKEGVKLVEKLIKIIELDNIKYNSIIDRILLLRIANVLSYIYWCDHGTPGISPYAVYLQGNNLGADIKCPICKKDLHEIKIIIVNPVIYSLMRLWGGILPALVGWYLTTRNIMWTADVKINQHEYGDIIFKVQNDFVLIECKIHDREKNEKQIKEVIKKDLKQAFEHLNFWIEKRVNLKKTVVLTNFLSNEKFDKAKKAALNELDENLRDKIINNLIEIHPLVEIPKIFDKTYYSVI